MSLESHHHAALIETARSELDRAHRAAVSAASGEVRRGLDLALAALREAGEADPALSGMVGKLETALADLDAGALSEMEALIEGVRTELDRFSA